MPPRRGSCGGRSFYELRHLALAANGFAGGQVVVSAVAEREVKVEEIARGEGREVLGGAVFGGVHVSDHTQAVA